MTALTHEALMLAEDLRSAADYAEREGFERATIWLTLERTRFIAAQLSGGAGEPVAYMHSAHIAIFQVGESPGIAWASADKTDFYDTPLYATPPVERAVVPVAWARMDGGRIVGLTSIKHIADDWERDGLSVTRLAARQPLPQDVINLVIAAREFWDYHGSMLEESFALDKALEPFASRVPYENEPDATPPTATGDMERSDHAATYRKAVDAVNRMRDDGASAPEVKPPAPVADDLVERTLELAEEAGNRGEVIFEMRFNELAARLADDAAVIAGKDAEIERLKSGQEASECMWKDKPCTCGGADCEQADFGWPTRPSGNNADEWCLWLSELEDVGNAYKAVQIATALDAAEARITDLQAKYDQLLEGFREHDRGWKAANAEKADQQAEVGGGCGSCWSRA